ncbi:hypothetical protein, partial [Lysobacter capsici]|uniref:hypothetical protein n=1 Tax=Lysobacter capsici TaxID=435897 RepID=UPI00398D4D6A
SRWRTAHIHVRRPTGVLLISRVTSLAALDGLRGFGLKQKRHGLPVGAARAATAKRNCDAGFGVVELSRSRLASLLQGLQCRYVVS